MHQQKLSDLMIILSSFVITLTLQQNIVNNTLNQNIRTNDESVVEFNQSMQQKQPENTTSIPKWFVKLVNNDNNNDHNNTNHSNNTSSLLSSVLNSINQQQKTLNLNNVIEKNSTLSSSILMKINSTTPTTTITLISNQSNETINDCIDGKQYWNKRTGKCSDCLTKCPSNAIITHRCNRTKNMECVCKQGWYMSILDGQCKQCSECPSGYGVWRTCRWSRNTVCRQCQPGTFSGVSVGTLGCIPCTKCGPNQEMISGCDGNRDTVCIDRTALMDSYLNIIDDSQLQQQQQQQQIISNSDSSTFDDSILFSNNNNNIDRNINNGNSNMTSNTYHLLPLYISMLIIVVFTFCIYALLQLKCNNNHQNNYNHNHQIHSNNNNLNSLILRCNNNNQSKHIIDNVGNNQQKLLYTTTTTASSPSSFNNCINNEQLSCIHYHNQHHQPYNIPKWLSNQTQNDLFPSYTNYNYDDINFFRSSSLNKNESLLLLSSSSSAKKLNNNNNNGKKSFNNFFINNLYNNDNTSKLNTKSTTPAKSTLNSIQSIPLISDDVEHLTIEIRQALENMLGKDSELWRLLAIELGYDEKHLIQFETKATTMINGSKMIDTFKAIRLLLLDWSSQMTTSSDNDINHNHHQQQQQSLSYENQNFGPPSLATLSNALIRIGRVDCARIVLRQNYQQQQQQQQQQQKK